MRGAEAPKIFSAFPQTAYRGREAERQAGHPLFAAYTICPPTYCNQIIFSPRGFRTVFSLALFAACFAHGREKMHIAARKKAEKPNTFPSASRLFCGGSRDLRYTDIIFEGKEGSHAL